MKYKRKTKRRNLKERKGKGKFYKFFQKKKYEKQMLMNNNLSVDTKIIDEKEEDN